MRIWVPGCELIRVRAMTCVDAMRRILLMQTVSERSAWIRRGWEDGKKGWKRAMADVPERWRQAYMSGYRRAEADGRVEG